MTRHQYKDGKLLDVVAQFALPILIGMIWGWRSGGYDLVALFFAVGAVQVLSFCCWIFITPNGYRTLGRKLYAFVLSCLALAGLPALMDNDYTFIYLFIMLVSGPLMAIFYLVLTFYEFRSVREEDILAEIDSE